MNVAVLTRIFVVVTILLACIWTTSQATHVCAADVRTFTDIHRNVQLVNWNGDGRGIFANETGEEFAIDVTDIVRYGSGESIRAGQGVILVDGTVLAGRIIGVDQKACEVQGEHFRVTIPRPLVRSLMVHVGDLGNSQQDWAAEAISAEGLDDRILMINGDWLQGTLVGEDHGALFQAGMANLILERSEQRRTISWKGIRGIIFSPVLTPQSPPMGHGIMIGLKDGSCLVASRLALDSAGNWAIQLVCGWEIVARRNRFAPSEICYITSIANSPTTSHQIIDLSSALRIRSNPLLGQQELVVVDKPRTISHFAAIGDRWLSNTISMPAGYQAVFRLPQNSVRFQAETAVTEPLVDLPREVDMQPIRLSISLVQSGGKITEAWSSEQNKGQPWSWADIETANATALILQVERSSNLPPSGQGVWIAPVISTAP